MKSSAAEDRELRPRVKHACELDFDDPPKDQMPMMLRCRLDDRDRYKLEPGCNRPEVMKRLLGLGMLVGSAKDEAESWLAGRSPRGFVTGRR